MKISNFRVRTQILLLFTPIIIFVIAILLLSYLLIFNYLGTVFTSYSLELLVRETNNQLTTQLRYYDQRLKTIITQSIFYNQRKLVFRKQNMFLNTYLFVDINFENIQIDSPIFCPSFISNQDSKSIFCMMAYQYDDSNFTETEDQLKKQFKVIALFHSLIFIFDNSQFIVTGIAYTTNDNIPILGTWPALNSTLSYNAHQRSWYKSHISSMSNGKQYQYSDLFTTILGSYTISISQNITNKEGKYEGIVFDLIDFNSFKKNFNANYILANPKGQIIIGQFNYPPNTTNPIFFFNETVTGYNQNDWDSILLGLNSSNTDERFGNCNQDISIYLCRQNSLYNQDTLLIYQQLNNPYPSDIVIILKNMSEIYLQIKSLQSDIKTIFTNSTIFSMEIMFFTSITLFILFNISLNKITNQLKILIKYTKFQQNNLEFLKKDDQSKQKISQILLFEKYQYVIKDESHSDNALDQLRLSYFQLIYLMKGTQGGFRKTDICFDFENRQYPKNRHNFKIQNIDRIADYLGQINEKYLRKLIFLLRNNYKI